MRPPGSFKLAGRTRSASNYLDPLALGLGLGRSHRIVESLRSQITELRGEEEDDRLLRIRQVFEKPREIFRVEFERPTLSYQRTTLLDRDALEDLLESEEIRDLLIHPQSDD